MKLALAAAALICLSIAGVAGAAPSLPLVRTTPG